MKFIIYSTINSRNKLLKFHKNMINEYLKRLSRYTKTTIVYGNKPVKKISDNSHILLIDNSSTISSENLAENINNLRVSGISEIILIYDINQIKHFDVPYSIFSVSTMNFSEATELCIILEQIYRGYKILNNENYHK